MYLNRVYVGIIFYSKSVLFMFLSHCVRVKLLCKQNITRTFKCIYNNIYMYIRNCKCGARVAYSAKHYRWDHAVGT